ncbi:hypothetical protein Tco_1046781 [Tanacetum coccineum]
MYELLQMMQSFCEKLLQQKQVASIDQSPHQEMSIQDMDDLKQHYLDEMLSLSNDLQIKDYRNEKIDIRFRRKCESMIDELKGKFNGISIEINKKKELQHLEQVTNLSTYPSQHFKYFCYDDDDDYDYEKIIKSSVENLVPILSESKDLTNYESECDMAVCDDSSSKNEGLDDIISIPPGKEIDHLDAIPDSVQSLLNHANTIIFLIEEFAGELAPIDPIPPGIVEADFDPEEDIRLIEKLLNDDSSPHSLEELNYEILDAIIEDPLMEEIDIFLAPDNSIPPGIENDDYDSEGDVLFLEELLNDDSLSLPKYESFHFDFYNVPSSPRPPEKPPDDDVYFDIEPDTGVLTTKVVDDIYDNSTREFYVHVPNVLPTLPTLYLVFDTLLPFSFENEDKVFNPGILISKRRNLLLFYLIRALKFFSLLMILKDFTDYEDSRTRCFVLRSLELQIRSMLISGIRYPRSY